MPSKYVIDTNVLLQAKNIYYRFDFCGGFWDWLRAGFDDDRIFSCQKVYSEIKTGDSKKDCPVRAWCDKTDPRFFLDDTDDAQVMTHYATLQQWATKEPQYTAAAKLKFAEEQNADAFLIAVAKRHGYVIITHELEAPEAKRTIPIPNAASAIGVKCSNVYDVLSQHAKTTFIYKP